MALTSISQAVKTEVEIGWLQNAIAAKQTEANEWIAVATTAKTIGGRQFAADNVKAIYQEALILSKRLARLEVQQ